MFLIPIAVVALLAGLWAWKHRDDQRRLRASRRARIKRVKRRQRLQQRLEHKAGDPLAARTLALREAQRLGIRPSSVEALEAALRKIARKDGKPGVHASFSRL